MNGDWLAVPDIMERTGRSLPTVRTWLQERDLVGMRRGPNHAMMVPSAFVTDQGPLKSLRGTVSVLADSGMSDDEILEWLGRPDDTLLGGSPIGALEGGHKTEVRRRAQEEAF
ncbi:MAG: Rv2175c family DNA-binding protein [Ornithinimicrobium sp.]